MKGAADVDGDPAGDNEQNDGAGKYDGNGTALVITKALDEIPNQVVHRIYSTEIWFQTAFATAVPGYAQTQNKSAAGAVVVRKALNSRSAGRIGAFTSVDTLRNRMKR